ncbi:MAG TPA: RagB/SusD family nutrient uptake outer membrane protein [Chitinophagaceae bacterium]
MKKIKFLALPLLLSLVMAGCKKDFLTTEPSNAVGPEKLFGTTGKIQLYLDGAYKKMFAFSPGGSGRHDDYGQKSWDLSNDLMGQDMIVHTQGYGWYNAVYQYTEWQQATANRQPHNAWYYYYSMIGSANTILDNIDAAAGTQAEKDNLKGQAYGLRAYAYYYLANYWQQTYKGNETAKGVPVHTSAKETDTKSRGTLQQVYDQIETDLNNAETLLTGKPRASKVAIDVSVVRGFKARVALLKEDWATAATKANQARQGYTLMSSAQYQSGFSQISNPEWMWGSLIPSAEATIYASFFSHIDISTGGYAALGGQKKIAKDLYDQIPAGDVRKTVFRAPGTGTSANPDYNQLKFRVPTPGNWAADYLYMRAAEMYLIEAEALARQGQDAPARTVLETLVQTRYPAYSAASFSGTALINEILLQRRIELWGEGFALIDIKRLKNGMNRPTGPGNHGSPNFNPGIYTTTAADPRYLMKIPQNELDNNPKIPLSDQNP